MMAMIKGAAAPERRHSHNFFMPAFGEKRALGCRHWCCRGLRNHSRWWRTGKPVNYVLFLQCGNLLRRRDAQRPKIERWKRKRLKTFPANKSSSGCRFLVAFQRGHWHMGALPGTWFSLNLGGFRENGHRDASRRMAVNARGIKSAKRCFLLLHEVCIGR